MSSSSSSWSTAALLAGAVAVGAIAGGAAGYLVARRTVTTAATTAASAAVSAAAAAAVPRKQLRLAKRIILIRHGESMGNVDKALFTRLPDHLIPLTPRGERQAFEAGLRIREIVKQDPVVFFVSPYERTRGTFREVMRAMSDCSVVKVREDPRVREQDFGNWQGESDKQAAVAEARRRFGRFFYRIPEGESGADVSDRVSSFFETLFRAFNKPLFDPNTSVVIVTHGLTLRLFLARFFHWPIELFERSSNPDNAAFVVMERTEEETAGGGHYRLTPESASVVGLTAAECCEVDHMEEAHRMLLGRADIHIPAGASTSSAASSPSHAHHRHGHRFGPCSHKHFDGFTPCAEGAAASGGAGTRPDSPAGPHHDCAAATVSSTVPGIGGAGSMPLPPLRAPSVTRTNESVFSVDASSMDGTAGADSRASSTAASARANDAPAAVASAAFVGGSAADVSAASDASASAVAIASREPGAPPAVGAS